MVLMPSLALDIIITVALNTWLVVSNIETETKQNVTETG